jgi:UDP-N-acetylglucosamine--N-acetylmuramyl-(pentapeptide) pyrophosphoryl-undecaprenol N-acetylglucosamine transferase
MVRSGAAILIQEKDLTGEKLAAELRALEADRDRVGKMARQSGLLGRPEAAREIAEVCVSLCSRRLVREGRHLPAQSTPKALPPRGGGPG